MVCRLKKRPTSFVVFSHSAPTTAATPTTWCSLLNTRHTHKSTLSPPPRFFVLLRRGPWGEVPWHQGAVPLNGHGLSQTLRSASALVVASSEGFTWQGRSGQDTSLLSRCVRSHAYTPLRPLNAYTSIFLLSGCPLLHPVKRLLHEFLVLTIWPTDSQLALEDIEVLYRCHGLLRGLFSAIYNKHQIVSLI